MSIAGISSIRRLKDVAVVVGLHEFAPVGRRAAGGRKRRRLERLAEVCQDLPDRPWVPFVLGEHLDRTKSIQNRMVSHRS